jgi:anthraniloyl-CoA monooxygenase
MRIICIGAGPAGLYFAISAKRRDPGHDITVIERDPEGATYGWGVVYWDNLLDMLYSNDMESGRRIRSASRLWQEQDIRLGAGVAYLAGYGYSVTRAALIEILTERARQLGVSVLHDQPTDDLAAFSEADVIVGADGANSTVRGVHHQDFGTNLALGDNRYIWLGTSKVFDRFTFAFEQTPAGWLWFHAYPSSGNTSTCIVECSADTWRGHGFDHHGTEHSASVLEKVFERHLGGQPLISQSRDHKPARWQRFLSVTNDTWQHNNLVLLGDAAHTTHFTIGSGTRLAMIDAVTLAQSIYESPANPHAALKQYDRRRRPTLTPTQASAKASMQWFEHIDHYLDREAVEFAYSMSGRQGEQPPWRYQKHLANQIAATRTARRHYNTACRWYGACRRGERPLLATPLLRFLMH